MNRATVISAKNSSFFMISNAGIERLPAHGIQSTSEEKSQIAGLTPIAQLAE